MVAFLSLSLLLYKQAITSFDERPRS